MQCYLATVLFCPCALAVAQGQNRLGRPALTKKISLLPGNGDQRIKNRRLVLKLQASAVQASGKEGSSHSTQEPTKKTKYSPCPRHRPKVRRLLRLLADCRQNTSCSGWAEGPCFQWVFCRGNSDPLS